MNAPSDYKTGPLQPLYLAVKAAIRGGRPTSVYDIPPLTDAVMPVVVAALETQRAEVRAEVLAEAKVETVAWLVKKAAEQDTWDAAVLASKVDRGAVRAFLGTAHYRDALDAHRAEVLAEAGWEPCSPQWLTAHPGECGTAPRVVGDGDTSHWHPTVTRAQVRREVLGDDLNPSSLVLDAQAYRSLADDIAATMDDPDRWGADEPEDMILARYVKWLADGKPPRDDEWDGDQPPAGASTQPAPDFFQPDRTYTREHHGHRIEFRVEHVSTPPGANYRVAFGWRHDPDEGWAPSDADDMEGWTEVAEGGAR